MKQRNSNQTGRRPADMLDIYKYISSDLCAAYNRTGKFRKTFLSLQLRSTKIVGWPNTPVGKFVSQLGTWPVATRATTRRQRRETLGTRLNNSLVPGWGGVVWLCCVWFPKLWLVRVCWTGFTNTELREHNRELLTLRESIENFSGFNNQKW